MFETTQQKPAPSASRGPAPVAVQGGSKQRKGGPVSEAEAALAPSAEPSPAPPPNPVQKKASTPSRTEARHIQRSVQQKGTSADAGFIEVWRQKLVSALSTFTNYATHQLGSGKVAATLGFNLPVPNIPGAFVGAQFSCEIQHKGNKFAIKAMGGLTVLATGGVPGVAEAWAKAGAGMVIETETDTVGNAFKLLLHGALGNVQAGGEAMLGMSAKTRAHIGDFKGMMSGLMRHTVSGFGTSNALKRGVYGEGELGVKLGSTEVTTKGSVTNTASQSAGQRASSNGMEVATAIGIQNSGIVGAAELKGGAKSTELTVSVTLKESSLKAFGVVGTVVASLINSRKPNLAQGLNAAARVTKAKQKLEAALNKDDKGKGSGLKAELKWTRGASGPWKFSMTGSLVKGTQKVGDSKSKGFYFESGVEQAVVAFSE